MNLSSDHPASRSSNEGIRFAIAVLKTKHDPAHNINLARQRDCSVCEALIKLSDLVIESYERKNQTK